MAFTLRNRPLALGAVLAVAALLFAACSDDSAGPTATASTAIPTQTAAVSATLAPSATPTVAPPTATPTRVATPTPTATPTLPAGPALGHPKGTRSVDAGVDAVIAAIESGDRARIGALTQFESRACAKVSALGGPPQCPEGVADGTVIDVLPGGGCEGSYAPSDSLLKGEGGLIFAQNFSQALVYAVYRGGPGTARMKGDFIIIYAARVPAGWKAMSVGVTGGHLVSTSAGCSATPEQELARSAPASILLSPPQ